MWTLVLGKHLKPLISYPEFHPITSSRYYSLLRGENDSKQSDEFQATDLGKTRKTGNDKILTFSGLPSLLLSFDYVGTNKNSRASLAHFPPFHPFICSVYVVPTPYKGLQAKGEYHESFSGRVLNTESYWRFRAPAYVLRHIQLLNLSKLCLKNIWPNKY